MEPSIEEYMSGGMDMACGTLVFVLIICTMFRLKRHSANNLIMLGMFGTLFCSLASNTYVQITTCIGQNYKMWSFFHITDYVCMMITIILFHIYLKYDFAPYVKIPNIYLWLVGIICGVEGVLYLISQWTCFLFVTDPVSGYSHTSYYAFSQVPLAIVILIDFLILLVNYKDIPFRNLSVWAIYVIISIASVVASFWVAFPLVYVSLTAIALILYVQLELEKDLLIAKQENRIREEQTKVALVQIKPHFIFNCLAIVRVLCKTDPVAAEETVKRFSNFLRGTIDSLDQTEAVTFEDELYIVNNYLYLEKLRFQDLLKVEKNIEVNNFKIPSLTLQPVVENAIKHGIRGKVGGGTVRISTYEMGNEFVVEVTDDGVGFDMDEYKKDGKNHVGMKSVESRLENMCGGKLEIFSTPGVGTKAFIHIPKKNQLIYESLA